MGARSESAITAPSPSILSNSSDHRGRLKRCSVIRLTLWHEVQAPFTLAAIGPGGSGLPGALGACALDRTTDTASTDAKTKIAGKTRWNKRESSKHSRPS